MSWSNDDETAPDVERGAGLQDTIDDVDVALDVLVLLVSRALGGGRLDSDEDAPESRPLHGRHERGVLGDVERGLRVELEGPAVALLPLLDAREDGADGLLVADEVVIDEEDASAEARRVDRVELRVHLLRRLGSRDTPEDHDDVAELA